MVISKVYNWKFISKNLTKTIIRGGEFMKKVRKSIILLLVLVLISVLTLGCGGSDKGATGGEDKKIGRAHV